jgi:hypothetical protein
MATAFDVLPYDSRRVGVRMLRVEDRGVGLWAIVNDMRSNLARDGEWEYEWSPSNRDEAFLARSRWPSAREAIAFARKWARRLGAI